MDWNSLPKKVLVLKNLQESRDQVAHVVAPFPLKFAEIKPSNPRSLILLLHGLDERGLRIQRKLMKYLPEDAHVIAPNGPFPLARVKSDRVDFGYAWHFYDPFTKSYEIDQSFTRGLLKDLLEKLNPHKLPVVIIGFSQGGYIAPGIAFEVPETQLVVGIGCEFRPHFFPTLPHFKLLSVHGLDDKIIPATHAEENNQLLKARGIEVAWVPLQNTAHEINSAVGEVIRAALEKYAKPSL